MMIHDNKDDFLKVLERTSGQTGFSLGFLEKDYYITILLTGINSLSDGLILKGGTCLNKIYYSYYRLSEDLDFSMKLPAGDVTRTTRSNLMKPVKEKIREFAKNRGMTVEGIDRAGRNVSKQYIFQIEYGSVVVDKTQTIKLEIGLRFNPFLPVSKKSVSHTFLHPFTKEPLFDGGSVNCFALKELVAEKLRAAATRLTIAPRDFYDLGYLLKSGFNFKDPEFWQLFKKKLTEDEFDTDLKKYRFNLGRSDQEISDMSARIEAELLDVLTLEEKKTFNLANTLMNINAVLKNME
ncbi:MAG: nucleotidyl transferase AbiEii/AbiGii toxin family protein [Candidatus Omnitrophica bacterium]|nr:nucleotidyl transferase AbiEii/AbiGii toxin family protein [Candidatus Omnitrophota bacterium]